MMSLLPTTSLIAVLAAGMITPGSLAYAQETYHIDDIELEQIAEVENNDPNVRYEYSQYGQVRVREIPLSPKEVFITGSFSSQGEPYVIVSGVFPDTCHKWSRSEVTHKSALLHEVQLFATVSNASCLYVRTPYIKEIRLSTPEEPISRGEHTIRFFNEDGSHFERTLMVE